MAKHDVFFEIPARSLGKADVEFRVRRDGVVVGTLKVSKGNVVWVPKNYTYGYQMSWDQFDSMMQENGRKQRGG